METSSLEKLTFLPEKENILGGVHSSLSSSHFKFGVEIGGRQSQILQNVKFEAVEIRNSYFFLDSKSDFSLMAVLFCKAQDLSFQGVHTVMEGFVHADFSLSADVILLSCVLHGYLLAKIPGNKYKCRLKNLIYLFNQNPEISRRKI